MSKCCSKVAVVKGSDAPIPGEKPTPTAPPTGGALPKPPPKENPGELSKKERQHNKEAFMGAYVKWLNEQSQVLRISIALGDPDAENIVRITYESFKAGAIYAVYGVETASRTPKSRPKGSTDKILKEFLKLREGK